MNVQVRITNIAEIRAAFSKAPAEMTRQLNNAIRLSIFDIERDSKMNTPVATGFLRSSHQTMFRNLYGEVSPSANYAIFVHEGTRYMRKRPFLLEATQSKEGAVQRNFEGAVQNVFDKIGREV